MESFLLYLLAVALCSGLLYGCYRLLMSREALFAVNRATLLLIVPLSLAVPLVTLPGEYSLRKAAQAAEAPWLGKMGAPDARREGVSPLETVQAGPDLPASVSDDSIGEAAGSSSRYFSPASLLFWLYLAGVAVMLGLFVREIAGVLLLLRRAPIRRVGKCRIAVLPGEVSAWSFGRYIVLSEDDYEHNRDEILTHELAHWKHRHLWDLSLLTLAQAVLWFNPVVHLLKRDLREVHEYQADRYALRKVRDSVRYQKLVIQKCIGKQFVLATGFHTYRLIKKRIAMMNQMKKSTFARWKVLGYVPLLALSLALFSQRGEARPAEDGETTDDPAKVSLALTMPEGCMVLNDGGYRMGLVPSDSYQGREVMMIGSPEGPEGPEGLPKNRHASLKKEFSVESYIGKRIRITSQVKMENARMGGLTCFMEVEENGQVVGRGVGDYKSGTEDWQQAEIVVDIKPGTQTLYCGGDLSGNGYVSFTDPKVEVVDNSVPLKPQ